MRLWTTIAAALLLPMLAAANPMRPAELGQMSAEMEHVGSSSVGFLFWDAFDANLWAPEGRFSWERPAALSLTYRTDFSKRKLTDSTIKEMKRIAGWKPERLADFRANIAPCMSDVVAGDRFTAASPTPDRIVLYLNGEQRCDLTEPGLRRAYLGIWLSQNSRFPDESRKLMGATP